MARVTGLEPAASGVTGRRSNQLSYTRVAIPTLSGGRDVYASPRRRSSGFGGLVQRVAVAVAWAGTSRLEQAFIFARSGCWLAKPKLAPVR